MAHFSDMSKICQSNLDAVFSQRGRRILVDENGMGGRRCFVCQGGQFGGLR